MMKSSQHNFEKRSDELNKLYSQKIELQKKKLFDEMND